MPGKESSQCWTRLILDLHAKEPLFAVVDAVQHDMPEGAWFSLHLVRKKEGIRLTCEQMTSDATTWHYDLLNRSESTTALCFANPQTLNSLEQFLLAFGEKNGLDFSQAGPEFFQYVHCLVSLLPHRFPYACGVAIQFSDQDVQSTIKSALPDGVGLVSHYRENVVIDPSLLITSLGNRSLDFNLEIIENLSLGEDVFLLGPEPDSWEYVFSCGTDTAFIADMNKCILPASAINICGYEYRLYKTNRQDFLQSVLNAADNSATDFQTAILPSTISVKSAKEAIYELLDVNRSLWNCGDLLNRLPWFAAGNIIHQDTPTFCYFAKERLSPILDKIDIQDRCVWVG